MVDKSTRGYASHELLGIISTLDGPRFTEPSLSKTESKKLKRPCNKVLNYCIMPDPDCLNKNLDH
jgi:hypothetical protein